MRADRLLSILLTMQVKPRVTAGELANELEVSERTIYRDMEALSIAGIPVIAERGHHGGWSLLEGYRANLNALNTREIQTLFLNQPLFADLGLEGAAQNALLKLLATLPQEHRQQAEAINQRLYIDLTGWQRSKEDVSWLPITQEAIWKDRKLQIAYRRSDGEVVERVIDPLGLVAKGSVWYLVGAVDGETRTYRVSRIQSAALTDQPCRRPPDFDLKTYWEQSTVEFFENIPRHPAVVRVSPAILPRLRYAGTFVKIDAVLPPEPDGWSTVHLHFDIPEEAREFVLGFGTFIEVIEPTELRDQVIEMAKAVVAFYQK